MKSGGISQIAYTSEDMIKDNVVFTQERWDVHTDSAYLQAASNSRGVGPKLGFDISTATGTHLAIDYVYNH